jgi:hypothetical protein
MLLYATNMQDSRFLGRFPSPETLKKSASEFSITGSNDPTIERRPQNVLQFALTDSQLMALQTRRVPDGVQPTDLQMHAQRALDVMAGIITDITSR